MTESIAPYSAGPISDGGMDPRNHQVPGTAKVTVGQIEDLMKRVSYVTAPRLGERTSTFVHAYLDGKFFLGSGHSGCIDPANFDAEKGQKIACRKAEVLALERLWELEGYALYKSLNL